MRVKTMTISLYHQAYEATATGVISRLWKTTMTMRIYPPHKEVGGGQRRQTHRTGGKVVRNRKISPKIWNFLAQVEVQNHPHVYALVHPRLRYPPGGLLWSS